MSELRLLLVHLDASASCEARARAARALAGAHDSRVVALHVEATPVPDLLYGSGTGQVAAAALEAARAERRQRAREVFDRVFGDRPATAWVERRGDAPAALFAQHARLADLVVLGARAPATDRSVLLPEDFVDAVIFGAGGPVLVLPRDGQGLAPSDLAGTALVAWKSTPPSTRAMRGALPLLRACRAVHVVIWGEDAEPPRGPGPGPDVGEYLRAHGVAAEVHRDAVLPHDVGLAIANAARQLGAGLVVMGCYGQSRARERWLGGATRSMLATVPVPLLMAH